MAVGGWASQRRGSRFDALRLLKALSPSKGTGMVHHFQLPKCKSSARRFAKAEVRGASPRGSTTSSYPSATIPPPSCYPRS